jgi:carboxypeptidase PM20D1
MYIEKCIRRLQGAIQIPTCSNPNPEDTDWDLFLDFIHYLEDAYPEIHHHLDRRIVNNYGLVFHWPAAGAIAENSAGSMPILFTAHYDVVAATDEGWTHPPFSGYDDGSRVWGRGSLDDKGSLICILEAVEALLMDGYKPPRDIYFAFGFDEEQGGSLGAQKIAAYFKEQNIHFQYVFDEGGAILDGSMMGVAPALAVVGIAEKGNNSFRFHFEGAQGHSSMPPKHTAIGTMAAFIEAVENKPFPLRLTPTVEEMLKALAPYQKGLTGKALANPGLFFPVIKKVLLKNPQTAAMLRTSVSFTMTQAGTGHNILPKSASCVANVRILQGDSVESVKAYFRSFGFDFSIEPLLENEPTGISDVHSEAMQHVTACIKKVFDNTVPLPYLMVGGTDSRYYGEVANDSFRFLPCRLTSEELGSMHAVNESISHENIAGMIRFYRTLLESI